MVTRKHKHFYHNFSICSLCWLRNSRSSAPDALGTHMKYLKSFSSAKRIQMLMRVKNWIHKFTEYTKLNKIVSITFKLLF